MTDKPVTEKQLYETAQTIRRFITEATRAVLLNNPATASQADYDCAVALNSIFDVKHQI